MKKYITIAIIVVLSACGESEQTPETIRAEIDEGLIYISKPAFRKFLIESNISTKEFLFQMKKQGVDIEQRKKRMGAGWKDATGALNIDTFVIPTSAFNKELFD